MLRQNLLNAMVIAALGTTAIGQVPDTKTGVVTFYITSTAGGRLPAGAVRLDSKLVHRTYQTAERDQVTARLPYGDYIVTFESPTLRAITREVTIDKPENFFVLATNGDRVVYDVPHAPASISVRVQPDAACTPGGFLWIKLTGVFSGYAAERKVRPFGFALFEALEFGTYVITVVDGKEVRATKSAETSGTISIVNVSLAPCENAEANKNH